MPPGLPPPAIPIWGRLLVVCPVVPEPVFPVRGALLPIVPLRVVVEPGAEVLVGAIPPVVVPLLGLLLLGPCVPFPPDPPPGVLCATVCDPSAVRAIFIVWVVDIGSGPNRSKAFFVVTQGLSSPGRLLLHLLKSMSG